MDYHCMYVHVMSVKWQLYTSSREVDIREGLGLEKSLHPEPSVVMEMVGDNWKQTNKQTTTVQIFVQTTTYIFFSFDNILKKL